MDIIFLIIAGVYVNGKAKQKGLNNTLWVVMMVLICIFFELAGFIISFAINGGQIILSLVFGFVSLIGGFLLVKSRLDKVPDQRSDNNNNMG